MASINVKLTFVEGALGTAPNDKDIYRNFIASKAPVQEAEDQEVDSLPLDLEKGITVYSRDENGSPIFWDYQIRGFFKDACGMLNRAGGKDENGKKKAVNESSKMKAFKKNIDGLIFVSPRQIPIQLSGDIGYCQRSLRAATMQGERTTLAMSEEVPAASTMQFTVVCIVPEHMAAVREWLNYGFLRGLGQWRNSGKGKFVWEELDENGAVIGGNASLSDAERLALVC